MVLGRRIPLHLDERAANRDNAICVTDLGDHTMSKRKLLQMQDYHINIFYSEDDGGYLADIPDLKARSAFGRTPAEALEQLQKAKELWLEAARAEGKPIPVPKYRPVIHQAG